MSPSRRFTSNRYHLVHFLLLHLFWVSDIVVSRQKYKRKLQRREVPSISDYSNAHSDYCVCSYYHASRRACIEWGLGSCHSDNVLYCPNCIVHTKTLHNNLQTLQEPVYRRFDTGSAEDKRRYTRGEFQYFLIYY